MRQINVQNYHFLKILRQISTFLNFNAPLLFLSHTHARFLFLSQTIFLFLPIPLSISLFLVNFFVSRAIREEEPCNELLLHKFPKRTVLFYSIKQIPSRMNRLNKHLFITKAKLMHYKHKSKCREALCSRKQKRAHSQWPSPSLNGTWAVVHLFPLFFLRSGKSGNNEKFSWSLFLF